MNALRHGLTGQIEVTTPEEKDAKDKFFTEIISSLAPEGGIERQFAHSIAEDHWRGVVSDEPVRHSASEPYPRDVPSKRSTCGRRAKTIENNIFTLACSFTAAQARSVRCAADFEEDSTGETDSPEIDQALADARTFVADPARFQLLTVYERRIHGNMTKSLKQLLELQAIRRAAETERAESQKALRAQALRPASEKETRLLTQLDAMEGTPCGQALSPQSAGNEKHLWSAFGLVFSNAEIAQIVRHVSRLHAAQAQVRCAATPSKAARQAESAN